MAAEFPRARARVPVRADFLLTGISQLVTCAGTGADMLGTIDDAALAAHQGLIVWCGPASTVASNVQLASDALDLDAGDRLVLPGLVDSHAHLVYAGLRADEQAARLAGQPYDPLPGQGRGIQRSINATRASSSDELLALSLRRVNRMASYGTTTVEAKTGYGCDLESELRSLEVIARLQEKTALHVVATLLAAHVVPEEQANRRTEYVEMVVRDLLPRARDMARFCDVWCDPGAFDAAEARLILSEAKRLGYRLKLHASELDFGPGPALGVELGATSIDHVDYLSDADIEALAGGSTVAVVLPGTCFSLQMALRPPVRTMLSRGIAVALASDLNPGTCYCENLQMMVVLATHEMGMTPEEAILGVTLRGAQALSMDNQVGSLVVGKHCDLVVFDAESYLELPYHFGGNLVLATVVAGQVVSGGLGA